MESKIPLCIILAFVRMCSLFNPISAYPTGAPLVACEQMVPYHPATTTSGSPPFAINVSTAVYKPGSTIDGVVYSPKGVLFKGLLIEGRLAAGGINPVGTFEVVDNRTHTNCGTGYKQALTHSNNKEKTSIPFRWVAPDSPAGHVHFKLTIVESYNISRFWTKIYSEQIEDCSLNTTLPACQQGSSTQKPITSSTHKPVTSPIIPSGKIPYDKDCGSTKRCFPSCPGGCDYLVTWQSSEVDEDGVRFDIRVVLNYTENVWIAVGLSPEGTMNNTNVVACLLTSSGITLQSSHNVGYSNVLFDNDTLGISNMNGEKSGNILHCSYTRAKTADDKEFWDLSNDFYLLIGTGPVKNGSLSKHDHIPYKSDNKINFLTKPTPQPTSKTTVTPTTSPSGKIPYDKGCGSTKSCFPSCPGGCDYLVTWQNSDDDEDGVHFDISMVFNYTDNVWIAVGLSPEGTMNNTNVVACLLTSSGITLQSSHNVGYSNVLFDNVTLGISNMNGEKSGNILHCSYTRAKTADDKEFWDLSNDFYLLVGTGPVKNGLITKHDHIPFKSDQKINFMTKPTPTTPTTPTTKPTTNPPTTPHSGGKIPFDNGCGKTKGCFPSCHDGCDYLVTWQHISEKNDGIYDVTNDKSVTNDVIRGSHVQFDISMTVPFTEDVWIAVGLSPEGKMDQTNVAACLAQKSGMSLQSSYNEGYSNKPFENITMGISNLQAKMSGSIFSCTFLRAESLNHSHFYDLAQKIYLLVGMGPVVDGTMQQHIHRPYKSNDKIDFMKFTVETQSDSASTLVKLHGSLMVIAWMLCSSIGIVMARHGKSLMAGKLLFKFQYWFVFHRTLMMTAAVCVIVAFIAIFVEVKGFSKISAEAGMDFTKAHPYLGIVVTAFTVINPIMALFRPPPDGDRRYIFNWLHFSVGSLGHILAVVNIGFGVKLSAAYVDGAAKYIMFAYAGVFIFVYFTLEIFNRNRKIDRTRSVTSQSSESIEFSELTNYAKLNSNTDDTGAVDTTTCGTLGSILTIHSLLMLGLTVFLVLMICYPKLFHTGS